MLAGPALAGEALAPAALRPSLPPGNQGEGVLSGVRHILPELRDGLTHTARNLIPNAVLRGADMDVAVPDGGAVPTLAGRGLSARLSGRSHRASAIEATIDRALGLSLETRRALAAARAAHASRHAAAMRFLPTVTGRVDLGEGPNTAQPPGNVTRERRTTVGVEAGIPIFTSGVLTHQLQQARSLARAADMTFLAAERKAALDAALAHVDLRLQRRVADAVSDHRHALARVATIAKALYRAGEVSLTDVAIARANVEAVAADQADARRRLADADATFASITGRRAPDELSLPRTEAHLALETAIARAVGEDPQLAAQDHGAQALAHAALAERGRYGPQVSGYANATRDVTHSTKGRGDLDYTFGVRLSMPLIAPSAVASVSSAKEEAIAARYGVMEAERALRRRVAGLWNARAAAAGRAEALERQGRHVALTVKGTLREYQAGFRSITDVLEAQVKRLEAVIALEGAVHERASADLRLDFAMGAGSLGRSVMAHGSRGATR